MECAVHAVIQEPPTGAAFSVKLQDGRRRHLGMPWHPKSQLFNSRGFRALTSVCAPVTKFLREVCSLVEYYYLAAERPALVSMHACARGIVSALGVSIGYAYRLCRSTSAALSNYAIANSTLDFIPKLGSKLMVFKYGFFGHAMSLTAASNNRGVLLADALDRGSINISAVRVAHRDLLMLTQIYDDVGRPTVMSRSLGFDEDVDGGSFITCVSIDPMPGLGTTLMVGYSTGDVELWKESVCMTDLREALYEAVAQCRVTSYPFFCAFSPCGEVAVLLTVDDMYLIEWTGSSLSAVMLVEGSSADFWATTRTRVLAAEWLNAQEILSLTDNGQLWLSRRSEMGYWQRITQYILVDPLPEDAGFTSWISRMQYDGRGLLFIKMFGTHKIYQLRWDKTAMPDLTVVEFPARETMVQLKPAPSAEADESRTAGSLIVADFAIEAHSCVIAVVVSDRSAVYVYNYTNMRLLHTVEPPQCHLRVGGVKFLATGTGASDVFLAVKWVEISLEIFQDSEDFDVDHKVKPSNAAQSTRMTVLYAISSGAQGSQRWKEQTLSDILSVGDGVVASHVREYRPRRLHRREPVPSEAIPTLSVFRPTFPEKLVGGVNNVMMFDDSFAHRRHIFGKSLAKGGSGAFPLSGLPQVTNCVDAPLPGAGGVPRSLLSRAPEASAPVYSMEEFTRRKRGQL